MKGVTVCFDDVSFVLCPPFIIKEKEMSVSVSGDFDQNIKLLKGTADIVINFSCLKYQ